MNYNDRINNFRRIALTGLATSLYNEDSVTATELSLKTAKKARECMEVVKGLCDTVQELIETLDVDLEYNEESEELTLTHRLKKLANEANECYYSPFNEDAMTALELAGCTARHVNECIRLINEFADCLAEFTETYNIGYDENGKMLIIGE